MEWPIMRDGENIGRITGQREGRNIQLCGSCPFDTGWIYRLYLGTDKQPRGVYLGVMLPEGKRFVLRKTLPMARLEKLEENGELSGHIIWHRPGKPEPAEVPAPTEEPPMTPLPFPESALGPLPEGEHYVRAVFAACGGKYVEWEGRGYWLTRGKPGEPLGPVPFFCLLTWVPWKDSGWWVLCSDDQGEPCCLPE